MRILFLSSWYPYPPRNGSQLRIFNLLRGLSRRHEITLLTLADQAGPRAPAELTALCREIHVVRRREYNPTGARALSALLSPAPRSLVNTRVAEMDREIRATLLAGQHDLVIASQWGMASYWQAFAGRPAIFEEAELGVFAAKRDQARSRLARLRHQMPLLKLRLYLRRLLPGFGACTVVSNQEAALLCDMGNGHVPVEIIPNCVDLAAYEGFRSEPPSDSLIFTGSLGYFANHDAMCWFLREVYPRIQALVPRVQLTITGDRAMAPLPPASNVKLTGLVEDVRPLVASAAISLAPLRLGGGTRLKILEAMALRTPVVATTKGAEGLDVLDGEHAMIADTPESFAAAVVRLLRDPHLRARVAANGYDLVRSRYDWEVAMPRFLDLAERVALG